VVVSVIRLSSEHEQTTRQLPVIKPSVYLLRANAVKPEGPGLFHMLCLRVLALDRN
jgi:hypothetical protein